MIDNKEGFGYQVSDVSSKYIEFCKVVDECYEKHFIEINFDKKTIKFTEVYYNDDGIKFVPQDAPIEIIKWAIDILNEKKVVIYYE